MRSIVSLLPARPTFALAVLSLAAAHGAAVATPEFRVPMVVCVPGDAQSMANEHKLMLTGVARQAGRNPPPRAYFCPVFNPDFTSAVPTWRQLKLVYEDTTGLQRNVTVRLFEKGVGGTTEIAKVSSVAAVGVNVVAAPIAGPLDFARFSYYTTVEMARPGGVTPDVVDVHELRLSN